MDLFDRFLQERTYLKNVSPETLRYYKWVRRAFLPILAKPTKTGMLDCVAKLLADGVSPISVNTYLRGLKAYCRWLKSENLLKDDFKVQFLKTEQKVLQTFSPEHISRLIHWKPVRCSEKRLHTITMVLLDTGLRCQEVLTLRKDDLDFDNLILRVHGKGNKQRLVPMSLELRKILYRHVHRANGELIFCTRDGGKLSQRNLLRDLKILAKRLSISGVRFSAHTFRHTFAVNYLRNGGNVFYLQRILGHTTLEMTNRYVRSLGIGDLQAVHSRLSLLNHG